MSTPFIKKNKIPLSWQTPLQNQKKEELTAHDLFKKVNQLLALGRRDKLTEPFLTEKILDLVQANPHLVNTMEFPKTPEAIKNQIILPYFQNQKISHLEYTHTTQQLVYYNDKGEPEKKWSARSGNISGKVSSQNKGPLPPGTYLLNGAPHLKNEKNDDNWEAFCDAEKNCWSQKIEPEFEIERSLLAIHPDGGKPGTRGCIGLTEKDSQSLKTLLKNRDQNQPMRLRVKP